MAILVVGGAGYIGSHTVVELLNADFEVVVFDNLINSNEESLRRVEKITGKTVPLIVGDIRDENKLVEVFSEYSIDSVIHFAGLKAVGESVEKPIEYYSNNVCGSVALLSVMQQYGVKKIIFSSSATVYGAGAAIPYTEVMPRGAASNPYGATKVMVEQILEDHQAANNDWSVVLLRYFNPIGAHESGLIGEDPKGVPNNLMPFIAQVAVGRRDELAIFGDDYETDDGTCERDYVHVVDLAKGHVQALRSAEKKGIHIYNLGTGKPVSVKQMVASFEAETGVKIPFKIAPRRAGDLPAFWADSSKAQRELGWFAELDLSDMMRDTWRWQKKNPNGYQ